MAEFEHGVAQPADERARRPLLVVEDVTKRFAPRWRPFPRRRAWVEAVSDVSLTVFAGETLGVIGEAGSGKSTLARLILRQLDPTSGRIVFDGVDISKLRPRDMRPIRRDLQFVFGDPFGSLDPGRTVGETLATPFDTYRTEGDTGRKVTALVRRVGLEARDVLGRYPHQCSAGELQRIAIASAVALRPKLVVCDEPVSALDASVGEEILDLLEGLQDEFNLAYLFITRDAGDAVRMSDRIAVMHHGRVVTVAQATELRERERPDTHGLASPVGEP